MCDVRRKISVMQKIEQGEALWSANSKDGGAGGLL